jgi:hypothetical protein
MKSTQTWQGYPEFYVSNGSVYSPQAFYQAAKALSHWVAEYLSATFQPQFAPPTEGQNRRQIIDPLTGLKIPGMFY